MRLNEDVLTLIAQPIDSIMGRCENEAGTTSLCPRMQSRGGSDVVDEITHGLQQHLSWTKLCWVGRVFTSCRPRIFFDCAQGVTPGQSIPFRARYHLKTVKSFLPLAFTQLSNRTHGQAGALGCSLQRLGLVLFHVFHSWFGLTSPLLSINLFSSNWGIPPLGVRAAWMKQAGHTFSFLSSYPFS